jgi:hypothetical protein
MRKKLLEYAGLAASIVLIAFGIGSIVTGASGHSEVRNSLKREQIVGTPDMTPSAIKAEATKAGLKNVALPSCSVAGTPIDTGARAKCFASYMRVHTLEATGGQVYAEMGRYLDKNGKATNDVSAAAIDPATKKPVENRARDIWVTYTALSTALNTNDFAEQVSVFAIVMGIAMLLSGIGFGVLTLVPLRRAIKERTDASATVGAPVAAH